MCMIPVGQPRRLRSLALDKIIIKYLVDTCIRINLAKSGARCDNGGFLLLGQFIQFCDTCNVQVDLLKILLSVSEREEDREWNTHR